MIVAKEILINNKVPLTFHFTILDQQAIVYCGDGEEHTNTYYAIDTKYEDMPVSSVIFSDTTEETKQDMEQDYQLMTSRLVKKVDGLTALSLSVNIHPMMIKSEGDYFVPKVEKIIREELTELFSRES